MTIHLEELMNLKKEINKLRDDGIKARATMDEVENNIANLKDELKLLGIKNTDDVSSELRAMEDELERIYDEVKAKVNKFL